MTAAEFDARMRTIIETAPHDEVLRQGSMLIIEAFGEEGGAVIPSLAAWFRRGREVGQRWGHGKQYVTRRNG